MIKMSPGDVLYLRGGSYTPGYRIFIRKHDGGAPGAFKTIRSFPGESARIRRYGFLVDASFVRLENLHFVDGAGVHGSDQISDYGQERRGIQVVNCTFTGSVGWDFIGVIGDDILVEGNVIEMQGSSQGTQGHGIYVSHGSGAVVRNNVIRGYVEGYGIHVFDQRRGGDTGRFHRRIRNVVIERNTVTGSTRRSGIIAVAYDGAAIDNLTIRNNIVYGNGRHGIVVGAQASNIHIYNNTIYGNGGSAILVDTNYSGGTLSHVFTRNNVIDIGGSGVVDHISVTAHRGTIVADTNLYWPGPPRLSNLSDPHAVVGDPRYADAAKRDFHIQLGSAAIDRGLPLPAVPDDRDGVPRPRGKAFDIGAYEHR